MSLLRRRLRLSLDREGSLFTMAIRDDAGAGLTLSLPVAGASALVGAAWSMLLGGEDMSCEFAIERGDVTLLHPQPTPVTP